MRLGEGETTCYWLEPVGRVKWSLRRFSYGVSMSVDRVWEKERPGHRACPGAKPHTYKNGGAYWPGCHASVLLPSEHKMTIKTDPEGGWSTLAPVPKSRIPKHTDKRWPKKCEACGFGFRRGDQWQVNQQEIYIRSDTGKRVSFRGYGDAAFAGALYHAWWRENYSVIDSQGNERNYTGPDGICLMAICPNGNAWEVDGPASGGGGWTRTGDPRDPATLTVTPSIVAGDYHGFLQQGRFTAHIG